MSQDQTNAGGEGGASVAAKKKGLPMPLLVGGLMLVEGVVVFGAVKMLSAPAKSEAAQLHGDAHAAEEALVELSLVEDRFQNMQTGRVWLWDVQIFLKVKAKHEEHVQFVLQARAAEIKEGISLLFRRASHTQLKEPGLETMNRQITAYVNEVIGADDEGHPFVERVMIPRCKGLQID